MAGQALHRFVSFRVRPRLLCRPSSHVPAISRPTRPRHARTPLRAICSISHNGRCLSPPTSCANNRWDLQPTGDTLAGYHFWGHWFSGCPGSSLTFYKRRDGLYSSCNSDADCSFCEAYCRTFSATYKRCEPRLYNDQSRRNDCQESWSISNISPSQLLASCPLSSSPPTQCPMGWTAATSTSTRCFRRACTRVSNPHPLTLPASSHMA